MYIGPAHAWARSSADYKQTPFSGSTPPGWSGSGSGPSSARRATNGNRDEPSHYSVLGLSPTATDSEIKKAFHKLALQFHPEKVPEDEILLAEEKFKLINQAYSVLMDPTERRRYDLSFSY